MDMNMCIDIPLDLENKRYLIYEWGETCSLAMFEVRKRKMGLRGRKSNLSLAQEKENLEVQVGKHVYIVGVLRASQPQGLGNQRLFFH
jgi:hypothetical protein